MVGGLGERQSAKLVLGRKGLPIERGNNHIMFPDLPVF